MTALRAAGGEPDDLVSLQVFVTSVAEYKRVAAASWGAFGSTHFGRRYPAMGLFGVTELFDPEAKVELMGVAVLSRANERWSTCICRRAQRELYERDPRAGPRRSCKPIADRGRARPGQPSAGEGTGRPRAAGRASSEPDGVAATELCLIREALARGCTDAETAFALQGLGAYPIVQAGVAGAPARMDPGGRRRHRRGGVRADRARGRL